MCRSVTHFRLGFFFQGFMSGLWYGWRCTRACLLSYFSRVRLSATPWTVARQAPLSQDSPGRALERLAMRSSRLRLQPASLTPPASAGGLLTTSRLRSPRLAVTPTAWIPSCATEKPLLSPRGHRVPLSAVCSSAPPR